MKIVHAEINEVVDFTKNNANSIVIENPEFLYKLVSELYGQINGLAGSFVLSEKEKILDISKSVELITDFFNFDINNKGLINRIIGYLEKSAISEIYYERCQILMAGIERFIYDISYDSSLDIVFEKLNIGNVIKSIGLKISDDCYEEITDKLLAWMELVREFESDKLFVFVNLRSYIDSARMKLFISTANSHGYQMLLIDNKEYPLVDGEKRLVIDKDLCEI